MSSCAVCSLTRVSRFCFDTEHMRKLLMTSSSQCIEIYTVYAKTILVYSVMQFYFYYAPVTIVGGIKICPCLSVRPSVCPSVRHALRYRVYVINFSHSFHWIFLKSCIFVVDVLNMCMWVFGEARINFDRITTFGT